MAKTAQPSAWDRLQIVREKTRPTATDYIPMIFDRHYELHGDRCFGDDHAIWGGIAKIDEMPVTVIAQVKGHNLEENKRSNFSMPHPEAVSYTHLDVYKRQAYARADSRTGRRSPPCTPHPGWSRRAAPVGYRGFPAPLRKIRRPRSA